MRTILILICCSFFLSVNAQYERIVPKDTIVCAVDMNYGLLVTFDSDKYYSSNAAEVFYQFFNLETNTPTTPIFQVIETNYQLMLDGECFLGFDTPFVCIVDGIYGKLTMKGEIISPFDKERYLSFPDDSIEFIKQNGQWTMISPAGTKSFDALDVSDDYFRNTFILLHEGHISFVSPDYTFLDQYPVENLRNQEHGELIFFIKNKVGLANTDGTLLLPAIYDDVHPGDFYLIQWKGLWAIFDKKFEARTEFKYEAITNFNQRGIGTYQRGKKWGLINKKAQEMTPPIYDFIGRLTSDLSLVKQNGLFGYINQKGKEIFVPQFIKASPFYHGAYYSMGDKYGLLSKKGKILTDEIYDQIYLGVDYHRVKQGNLYGYINKRGVEVIPIAYEDAGSFQYELAYVSNGTKYGYINTKGEQIIDFLFDKDYKMDFNYSGIAHVRQGNNCCEINREGKIVSSKPCR